MSSEMLSFTYRINAPSTLSLKVSTHKNVTTGACSIPETDQNPVAPEMALPMARPKMMLALFISGLPIISTIRMVAKTEKPIPINLGSPQTNGLGALVFGQRA